MEYDNDSYYQEHYPAERSGNYSERQRLEQRDQYLQNSSPSNNFYDDSMRRDNLPRNPQRPNQRFSHQRQQLPRQDQYQDGYRSSYNQRTPNTRNQYRSSQRQNYYDAGSYQRDQNRAQDYYGSPYDETYNANRGYSNDYYNHPQEDYQYYQQDRKKGSGKPLMIILSVIVIVAAFILIAMLVKHNKGQNDSSKGLLPAEKQAAAQANTANKKSKNKADKDSTDCSETKSFMGLTFKIPKGWKINSSLTNKNDDSDGEWVVYSFEDGDVTRLITLGCFAGDGDSAFATGFLGAENIINLLISSFASDDFFVEDTVEHSTSVITGHQARTISGISDSADNRKTYVTIFSDGFNYFVLSSSANNAEKWIDKLHPNILTTIKSNKTYTATPKPQSEEKTSVDLVKNVDKKELMYISSGYSNYYYGVAIVTNNNTVDVSISGQGKFLSGGQTVSVKDDDISVVGPGQSSILYFMTDASSDEFFCDIKVTEAKYYYDVIAELDYTSEIAGDRAIVSVTNKGNRPAEFVKGYVLFFNQGYLVDSDWTYYTDDDSEIKVGDTISKEHRVYNAFDSIEVYFQGRSSKH